MFHHYNTLQRQEQQCQQYIELLVYVMEMLMEEL